MHTMWKQYVGKAETAFNNPLNNHREIQNPYPKTILVCKHLREKNQNFNKHASLAQTSSKHLKKFCNKLLILSENI